MGMFGVEQLFAGWGSRLAAVIVLGLSAGCVVNNPTVQPPPVPAPQASATSQDSVPASTPVPPVTSRPSGTAKKPALAGPGIYSFAFQGARGTIQVPTPRTDPRLEPYGDYRRLAKAPVVTYLIATVDNQSDDTINMYQVIVVTNDGRQIEATSVSNFVDQWRDAFAGENGNATKYNRGVELSNDSQFYLLPGAKGTAILATKSPIPSVKRVFVYPAGGFSRVEAHRTS
jgi:hypothetical protein